MTYNQYIDIENQNVSPDSLKVDYEYESKNRGPIFLNAEEYKLYNWIVSLKNSKKADKLSYILHARSLPKKTRTKYKEDILSSSLFAAIEKKSISLIKYLIKKGATVTPDHLIMAYETKFDEAKNLFIEMGINFRDE